MEKDVKSGLMEAPFLLGELLSSCEWENVDDPLWDKKLFLFFYFSVLPWYHIKFQ